MARASSMPSSPPPSRVAAAIAAAAASVLPLDRKRGSIGSNGGADAAGATSDVKRKTSERGWGRHPGEGVPHGRGRLGPAAGVGFGVQYVWGSAMGEGRVGGGPTLFAMAVEIKGESG